MDQFVDVADDIQIVLNNPANTTVGYAGASGSTMLTEALEVPENKALVIHSLFAYYSGIVIKSVVYVEADGLCRCGRDGIRMSGTARHWR